MNLQLSKSAPAVPGKLSNGDIMNIFKKVKQIASKVALLLAATSTAAFATGPDFTALTGAVDFSTVGPAVLAIAALLAVPLVIRKGAKMVLSAIR